MAVAVSQGTFQSVIRVKDEGSATVKSFADNVGADMMRASESFAKEAGKASDAAGKFDKTAAGSAGAVARLAGGVGSVAAAMALFGAQSAIAGLRTADSFQKMATRLGTTTEALSKLAFHAKLSDLPFEQLTQSMGVLAKNLTAVAETGKGQAAGALQKLGLDAKALIQLKPEEQIEALAAAFDKIENQTEKLGLLQQVFGRSGGNMAAFFEGGPAALAESARYLASTGGIVDSLTGARAEAFFDNLDKLSQAFAGIKNSLARGLAKDLVGLTGALVDLVQDSGGLKAAAVALEMTAQALLFVLKVVTTGGALIAASFGAVARAVAALVASAAALGRGDFAGAAEPLKAFVDDLKKSGNDLSQTLDKLWGKLDEAERKQRELGEKAASRALRAPRGVGGASPAGMLFPIDIEAFKQLVDAENASSGADPPQTVARAMAEVQARTEQREREHQERLLAQWQTYHAARAQFQVRYDQLSLESTAFLLNHVAQLMQSKSRTMFEIGKAAAIAETIVQTYKAAQGAYAALASIPYVGPALGIAAAAAAIASGMARVAAIKSTQFGAQAAAPVFAANPSTGLPVAASTAASVAAPPPARGVPAAPKREVNIYLAGEGSPTQAYIRDVLIPGLQEALEDGVTLNVRTV